MSPSEAFRSLPLARAALTAIVLHHRETIEADAGAAERHGLPCIGISALAMQGILRTVGDSPVCDRGSTGRGSGDRAVGDRGIDAAAAARHLVDLGLLYEHEGVAGADAQLQLARPCDAHVYTGSTAPNRRQLFLLTAVRLMLEGDADDCPPARAAFPLARASSSEGTSASEGASGSVLRELVLPGVARLLLPLTTGHAGPPSHAAIRRACIKHGLLCLWQPSGVVVTAAGSVVGAGVGTNTDEPGAWVPLTPVAVAALAGVLLSCSGEAGLDGVLLCPDADALEPHPTCGAAARPRPTPRSSRWRLHGWRCKGGPRIAQLSGGDMGAAVDRFTSAGSVGRLDDNTGAGMLVRAQVGMWHLLHAWHKAMEASGAAAPLPQLIPASLTITTTADATLARAALNRMGAHTTLDTKVAAAVGWPDQRTAWHREWVRAARTARVAVKLLDGTAWIRECLSEALVRDADWLPPAHLSAGAGRCDAAPVLSAPRHACAIM